MSGQKGLLLVLVDPAPNLEEELNDWYDSEHLPERRVLPGFETALRFTSLGDGPRYAAIYDLSGLSVLDTEAYLAVSGDNFSPWTRRVTSRSQPLRITARQVHPGSAATGICARLLLLRFRNVASGDLPSLAGALDNAVEREAGFLQSRLFACEEPDRDSAIAIAEFSGNRLPVIDGGKLAAGGAVLDLAAGYRPYRC